MNKWQVAVHEIGHVICALRFGVLATEVEISYCREGGWDGRTKWEDGKLDELPPSQEAVVHLGGLAALYFFEYNAEQLLAANDEIEVAGDCAKAAVILGLEKKSLVSILTAMPFGDSYSSEEVRRTDEYTKALEIVESNEHLIKFVANHLMRKRKLYAAEISALFSDMKMGEDEE